MPTLRPEVKKKWTEALRSGVFQQGVHTLHNRYDTFCCLGVLCSIAANEGVIPPPKFNDAYGEWFYGDPDQNDERSGTLPVAVQDWAYADFDPGDTQLADPYLGDHPASDWNDAHGANFNEIADLIEEHL